MVEPGDPILAAAELEAQPTRGFLFSDLRGYTAYVERAGAAAGARALTGYRDHVRAAVAQFRGAEIRTEGDSFYVVFPSVSAAVGCALAIVERPADAGEGPSVGVGVHAGETVDTDEGPVGSAINIAARVCATAKPGEVLVTDTVRALTKNVLDVRFVSRGRRQLKGVSEQVVLYAVERSTAPVTARTSIRSKLGLPVAAIALAVVLGGLAIRAMSPPGTGTPGPTASGAASASPALVPSAASPTATSTATQGATLTARERELLPHVPALYRDSCRSGPGTLGRAQVVCEVPDLGRITYIQFDNIEGMRAEYARRWGNLHDEAHVPGVSVCPERTYSRPALAGSGTQTGEIVCFENVGLPNIIWTDDSSHIISEAVADGGSVEAIRRWWERGQAGPQ